MTLESPFAHWIETVALPNWDVVTHEITMNRVQPYQNLQAFLAARPMDVANFAVWSKKCTILNTISSVAATPYNRLFEDTAVAQHRIARLIDYLPEEDSAQRIDEFIVQTRELPKHQGATVASLLLTVAHPSRFVDYPSTDSWTHFAQRLGYGLYPEGATHGERIVWASVFAGELIKTNSFRRHWKADAAHPMWVISGLNWTNKRLNS